MPECLRFRSHSISDGRRVVEVSSLCVNCLHPGRDLPECSSGHGCGDFQQRHHPLLQCSAIGLRSDLCRSDALTLSSGHTSNPTSSLNAFAFLWIPFRSELPDPVLIPILALSDTIWLPCLDFYILPYSFVSLTFSFPLDGLIPLRALPLTGLSLHGLLSWQPFPKVELGLLGLVIPDAIYDSKDSFLHWPHYAASPL